MVCRTCGARVGVDSLLVAAQQPCERCGRLLSGPLASGRPAGRPMMVAESLPSSQSLAYQSGSPAFLWLGVLVGMLAGPAAVGAIAYLSPMIALPVRGAVLGA